MFYIIRLFTTIIDIVNSMFCINNNQFYIFSNYYRELLACFQKKDSGIKIPKS